MRVMFRLAESAAGLPTLFLGLKNAIPAADGDSRPVLVTKRLKLRNNTCQRGDCLICLPC